MNNSNYNLRVKLEYIELQKSKRDVQRDCTKALIIRITLIRNGGEIITAMGVGV